MKKKLLYLILALVIVFTTGAFSFVDAAAAELQEVDAQDCDACQKKGGHWARIECHKNGTSTITLNAWGAAFFQDLWVYFADGHTKKFYFGETQWFKQDFDSCVVGFDSILYDPKLPGEGWTFEYWSGCPCYERPGPCSECGPPRREMPYEDQDMDANPALMIVKMSHEPCEIKGNMVDGFCKTEWNKVSNTSIASVYTEPYMAVLNWRDAGEEVMIEAVEIAAPEGTWYRIMDDRITIENYHDVRYLDMEGNSISFNEDGYYTAHAEAPCSLWPGPWFTWNPETGQHEFVYGYYADSDLAVRMMEDGLFDDYDTAIRFIEAAEGQGVVAFPVAE